MTKEEYKRDLIRMFDSLRDEYKGEERCVGLTCLSCPFNKKVCDKGKILIHSFEAIEIVENWAKEHPTATNSDKFKEVFGFKPYTKNCINGEEKVSCANCQYFYDDECAVQNRFWGAEYKLTKEGEE